ncbi:RNA-directed DNA polymerase, eukaryota [Tanacetum coccineum]
MSCGLSNKSDPPAPAIVLDDGCLKECDLSCSLLGKLKNFKVIPNIHAMLENKGFPNVNVTYMGGLWVLLTSDVSGTKDKLSNHKGVSSWFSEISSDSELFVSDERVIWVSLEGLPLKAMTHNTYSKIVSSWGEFLDEEINAANLASKRLLIKTKQHTLIKDSVKVIIKGKVYWIRVNEVDSWSPTLKFSENYLSSNNDSEDEGNDGNSELHVNEEDLEEGETTPTNDDPKFPPGFTPDIEIEQRTGEVAAQEHTIERTSQPQKINDDTKEGSSSSLNGNNFTKHIKTGGSILEVMDELVSIGLGHKAKKRWIQEINHKYGINFLAIQETKSANIKLFDIKAIWGNYSFDFVTSDAIGYSGGNLCIWDPNVFVKDNVTASDSFLAIRGTWLLTSLKLLNISVYAPQDHVEKRMLWEYFLHLIQGWEGEYVLMGDFNESASKMSKLDRFLVSEGLHSMFPSLSALCLDKNLSDHRPILMRELNTDYGPTPFRIFHSWFSLEGFDNLVKESWSKPVLAEKNSMDRLKKKFQNLKASIKMWRKVEMAQKAKVRWAIEGDENSKFFHGVINKKRSQLAIRGVLVDGEWISETAKVRNEFLMHFSNRFSAPPSSKLSLDSQFDKVLSQEQNDDLERAISKEEIKSTVWDCGTNKLPGPDGFTFEFIRKYWNIICVDIEDAVFHFFNTGTFSQGCNSSFIALILKMQDAKLVKDFRPISLIGCIYKIVTKVLANRLCTIIPDLISDVQSAFVTNRQILDGPFILSELLSWYKQKKFQSLIFKVDFEKAFDSIRWDYLDEVLLNFGFGSKWRGWINGCLSSSMGSVLVNGSPTTEFKFYKGLKQGDPLSQFLFILVMESLHLAFTNVLNAGIFKGVTLNELLTLSHFFFADDAVFVGKWEVSNILAIVNVLKIFHMASGLKINIHKSKLIRVGVSKEEVDSAARYVGCSTFTPPFNYLGITLGNNMAKISSWDDHINKLSTRLSKWKSKLLSIGGRFTLIKSVLSSIPLYHMSIFKVPMGVLNNMEAIRRNFLNGVSSYFAFNRALLFKWYWRFKSNESSLWARVIKAIHWINGSINGFKKPMHRSPWSVIICEINSLANKGINLLQFVKKKIGNGEDTRFWKDTWHSDVPLKNLYPRVFALEIVKDVTVAGKFSDSSFTLSLRRYPRGGVEKSQFDMLCSNLADVTLPQSRDRWVWNLDPNGDFSVKSARDFIDDLMLPKEGTATRWIKYIPLKINIFAWRVYLDKLPTRINISLHGIDIPNIMCPICNSSVESSDHLFFSCKLAKDLFKKVTRWWELEYVDIHSYGDWLEWLKSLKFQNRLKDIFEAICYVLWWSIWKHRNQSIFGGMKQRLETFFDDIVLLSFT